MIPQNRHKTGRELDRFNSSAGAGKAWASHAVCLDLRGFVSQCLCPKWGYNQPKFKFLKAAKMVVLPSRNKKNLDFTSEWWIRVDPELGDEIGWAAILWGLNLRERDDR